MANDNPYVFSKAYYTLTRILYYLNEVFLAKNKLKELHSVALKKNRIMLAFRMCIVFVEIRMNV